MFLSFNRSTFLSFLRKTYIFFILAIIYIPMIFVIFLSFNGQSSKENILLQINGLTIENYLKLFSNNEFLSSFLNSLLVVILVAPVSVIIAIITCFAIWFSKKYMKATIKGMYNANIAVPEIIAGISLSLLFTFVWLPLGLEFGYATVVISHISFCTPYAIVAIYPRIMSMKLNLIYASNDLGASNTKTFFKVVIPYLMPSIVSAFVIVSALSFDDFVITSLVNGNFNTISTSIYQSSKGIKGWIVTFGAIMIFCFIIGSLILFANKKIKMRGESKKWKRK